MFSLHCNRSILSALVLASCAGHPGKATELSDREAPQLQLMGEPAVHRQQPNRLIKQLSTLPNDPLSERQWSFMSSTQFRGAADIFGVEINAQRSSVVVAVVDSGVRLEHEDITTLPGYDFISDPAVANDGDGRDADPTDPGDWVETKDLGGTLSKDCQTTNSKWHGTAIAGIIGAQAGNLTGIAGAARQVELLPVRITGKCGGYVNDLIDGIRWAAGLNVPGVPDNHSPARVINLSVGFPGDCGAPLQRAIDDAVNVGAILVTAATNYAVNLDDSPHAPANCRNVLTIGATLRDGSVAAYSSIGSNLFLLGPGGSSGDGIITTDNNGKHKPEDDSSYGYHYGTSMAAAHVSATLATLVSAEPQLNNAQLRWALRGSAVPSGDPVCGAGLCGAGLLNTQRAVKLLMDGELPEVVDDAPDRAAVAEARLPETFAGSVSWMMLLLTMLIARSRCRRSPCRE